MQCYAVRDKGEGYEYESSAIRGLYQHRRGGIGENRMQRPADTSVGAEFQLAVRPIGSVALLTAEGLTGSRGSYYYATNAKPLGRTIA